MDKGDGTRNCSVRRPLLYIVFAFAAPVAAGYYCGLKVLILTAAACMLMLALSSRKWRLPAALCMVFISYLAGTANFVMYDIVRGAPVLQDGEVYEMTGKTVQINQKEMSDGTCRHQYRIRIYRPGGNIISSRDVLAVRYSENADDGMVPGDIIKVKGTAERPSPGRNPGCFDYSLYLRSVGINDVIKADSVEVLDGKGMHTVAGRLYVFRETFLSKLEQKAGHDASSMMGAILFGEKDEMDEDVLEEFRKNGTAHVLAVSGVKTLKLDIPLVPETRINWTFVPLHIAIIYILKLCLDEEIIPRCRFPCSRGYHKKYINWQKKQSFSVSQSYRKS